MTKFRHAKQNALDPSNYTFASIKLIANGDNPT